MVEKQIAIDLEKDDKWAKMLAGKISRKVVKQTVRSSKLCKCWPLTLVIQVMTTVYGVTFVGARDQIEKQLKDRKDISEEECWGAASYLAKKVRHRVFFF